MRVTPKPPLFQAEQSQLPGAAQSGCGIVPSPKFVAPPRRKVFRGFYLLVFSLYLGSTLPGLVHLGLGWLETIKVIRATDCFSHGHEAFPLLQ